MAGRRITIEFLGNSRDLVNAAQQGERATSRLGDKMKKFGKIAAIGLAAGAVIAGKALFDMTKGAIEDEAAQKKLANSLKNTAGATDAQIASVESWISAQGRALGVTDDELRPAIEKLTQATGDISEAQKLAALAMDASAARGKSLEVTSKALADAEDGRLGGLKKLGIETENAAGKTLSLEQIHKNMAKTFKGAAATSANTLEGKMGRLKLVLAEAGEEIGSKLIPVITKMATWFLNKGLPAIQALGSYLGEKLPPIFAKIREVISKVLGTVKGDVSGNMGAIKDTIKNVVAVIQGLWDRFGAHIIEYARSAFNNVRTIIGGVFKVIQGIFKVFSSLLKGDWKGAWEGIKMILKGAWKIIVGVVKQAFNLLRLAFKVGWTALKGIAGLAWEGIKKLVSLGVTALVNFVKSIPGKFKAGLSNLKGLMRDLFLNAMNAGLEKVKNIGGTILSWVAGIPGKLMNKIGDFKNAGKALIGAVVDGMKNAAGVISGIAGNVWDAVKGLLNGAIDKINSALEFNISLPGPDISINPPNIPHLARGTNFHRGGLALVGEQGPELVNLPRGAKVTPNGETMGAMRSLGGGGLTINFNGPVFGDPRAFAREVRTVLLKEKRLLGTDLGLA